MTQATSIFAILSSTVRSKVAFLKLPPAWSCVGALAGFHSPAEVLETASAPIPAAARRPVLSALLMLAPRDCLATEVLMAALSPGLRSVAAELTRWAPVEASEVDTLMAAAAWEALCALGGMSSTWPDRVVICRAREIARARLRAEARRRKREDLRCDVPDRPSMSEQDLAGVYVRDLVRCAVATGRIRQSAAELVWAARVEGWSESDIAELTGESAEAVSMRRLRAERALRRAVA
jgi:DNA-directed RNA polymerase specialized sigma24 family protein